MSNIDEIERDIDPPEPVRYDMIQIKKVWLSIKWDDGTIEDFDLPEDSPILSDHLSEIAYEKNRDILEDQAYKYGDPDSDY
jgi:hypothetical protein